MFKQKITLLQLLSVLMIVSTILIFGSGLAVNYKITNEEFVSQSLKTNKIYAAQLAHTADLYLKDKIQSLENSASIISKDFSNENVRQSELRQLANLEKDFDTFTIVTTDYEVIDASTNLQSFKEAVSKTDILKEAIALQKPFISTLFQMNTNTSIVFFSHPIVHEDGHPLGIIGGTINLEKNNLFHKILGEHYDLNDTTTSIIDHHGNILYHDTSEKIGEKIQNEAVVGPISEFRSGALQLKEDEHSVIGYASILQANWGVVLEQPYNEVIAPATLILKRTTFASLPFILISLFIILLTAQFITKPLRRLATLVEQTSKKKNTEKMKHVDDWYYEAHQMKQSIMKSIHSFQQQVSYYHTKSVVDPLTGLTNRRTMDDLLHRWIEEESSFVLVILDLDHFKNVNDTYGHTIGDDVLRYLANKMMKLIDGQDEICCRYGGEEFVVLFKEKPLPYVIEKIEALRQQLESTTSPTGKPITMSAGIGAFPLHTNAPAQLFELVDEALYHSKRNGRNQITIVTEQK